MAFMPNEHHKVPELSSGRDKSVGLLVTWMLFAKSQTAALDPFHTGLTYYPADGHVDWVGTLKLE